MSQFTPAHLAHVAVTALDRVASRAQVALGERRGGLVTLFLHHLFADEAEILTATHMPQEGVTIAGLRTILGYFAEAGYTFPSPEQILAGLDPTRRHLLLTFDDGYADNARVVPLLESFQATAVIFVSANHVLRQKSFWQDALYRRRVEQGRPPLAALIEITEIARGWTHRSEQRALELLGADALAVRSDTSRPLTTAELRSLAAHPRVRIGNHTCDHVPLAWCDAPVAREEMARAQALLADATGKLPLAIAYPYGCVDAHTGRLALEAGLKLGFTTEYRKAYPADLLTPGGRVAVGRFQPQGSAPLLPQCRYFRSDLMLHTRYQAAKNRLKAAVAGRRSG
jgi:peptidoglycan/xylan/chitin deacetylase (PgdA/CDA1 family)